MYPFVRTIAQLVSHRRAPSLPLGGVHVSQHMCWPWDLDAFMEMNHGRILTLLDQGRFVGAIRSGLYAAQKQNGWGMTMAGVCVRYRRRVRMFHRYEVRTRFIGFDEKFLYLDQTMWRNGDCLAQAIYRVAVTDANGIVRSQFVAGALETTVCQHVLPDWVKTWLKAEDMRPWPPKVGLARPRCSASNADNGAVGRKCRTRKGKFGVGMHLTGPASLTTPCW